MKILIGQTGKNIFHNTFFLRLECIFLSIFLFLFPIFSFYTIVKADVGTLIVEGGSIGTGGLGSGVGSLGLLGPVSVIITSALYSAGLNIHISEESASAGMTKTQYCVDQIINWKGNSNEAISYLSNDILRGACIDLDGVIYLTDTACDAIKQFGNWLTTNDNASFYDGDINQAGSGSNSDYNISVIGGTLPVLDFPADTGLTLTTDTGGTLTIQHTYGTGATKAGVFKCKRAGVDGYLVCVVLTDAVNYRYRIDGGTQRLGAINSNDPYLCYVAVGSVNAANCSAIPAVDIYENELASYLSTLDSSIRDLDNPWVDNPTTADLPDTFWGEKADWTDFVGGLALPEGYMGSIDAGILSDLQGELESTKDYVISLEDYIKALEDAINDTVADVPVEDVDDGTIVLVPDPPLVVEPEYEQVHPSDIPQDEELTPVLDPDIPAAPDDIINANMITGLKDVFPFCIPFDIYNLLNKFNATPQAPRFTFDYTVPVVNTTLHYDFDFSGFNSVAAVLRTMELVAAIVGLAMATRAIFIRS